MGSLNASTLELFPEEEELCDASNAFMQANEAMEMALLSRK
jgi:hypothetical protein